MEVHVVLHFRSVMEVHGSFRPLDEETVLDGGFDVRWRRLLRSISDSYISRLQSARSLAPHPTPPHQPRVSVRVATASTQLTGHRVVSSSLLLRIR